MGRHLDAYATIETVYYYRKGIARLNLEVE